MKFITTISGNFFYYRVRNLWKIMRIFIWPMLSHPKTTQVGVFSSPKSFPRTLERIGLIRAKKFASRNYLPDHCQFINVNLAGSAFAVCLLPTPGHTFYRQFFSFFNVCFAPSFKSYPEFIPKKSVISIVHSPAHRFCFLLGFHLVIDSFFIHSDLYPCFHPWTPSSDFRFDFWPLASDLTLRPGLRSLTFRPHTPQRGQRWPLSGSQSGDTTRTRSAPAGHPPNSDSHTLFVRIVKLKLDRICSTLQLN